MNNLYNLFAKSPNMGAQGAAGGFLQRLEQFRKTINGNPQDIVQTMLHNGKITQAQYDRAVQMTNEIMRSFK